MESKKQRSVIDPVARVFNPVQETWPERKLVSMVLIDVKGVLNHVSRNCLL